MPSHTADRQRAQCYLRSLKPSTLSYGRRRSRGESGGREDPTRTDNVYGQVTARRGAVGYSVVWKGLTWAGAKVHMGSNQEAYDAECAALAYALEIATQRTRLRNESQSFRMRRQLSDGWHRTIPAQDRNTPSRLKGTSRRCGGLSQASP